MVAITASVCLSFNRAEALQASAGSPQNTNTDFIRQSCASSLYSSLCYTSLAPYANAVAQDPIRLACVACNVSLAHIRSVSSHVSSVLHGPDARQLDKRTVSALQDCEETLGDGSDLTGQSIAELELLPSAKGTEVAWRVSNAQTWMSAALTNENTCVDGLTSASSSAVKADVTRRVRQAGQYTSNALALVNLLVGPNA
ncbi:hypothetical protein Taro_017558 [Colocasia esculenta]|uniref:Pectinesterase inhibitor domain-containing protein n=1 Tax=Colocasia esculenta TaxID=4460 RepID=A0A843URN0_COLES|nr:hypothetical protein [Colocasia esculenta]